MPKQLMTPGMRAQKKRAPAPKPAAAAAAATAKPKGKLPATGGASLTARTAINIDRSYDCVVCGASCRGIGYNPFPITPFVGGDACVTCYTTKVLPTIKARRKNGTFNREEATAARGLRKNIKKAEAEALKTAVATAADTVGSDVVSDSMGVLLLAEPTEEAAQQPPPPPPPLPNDLPSSIQDLLANAASAAAHGM